MLDLGMAAGFFDNDPLYDAYTGDYLYDGQFATYDGSQLDGSFVRRRTVSLMPELALPPRRVVMLYNEPWVLSDPIVDGFLGDPIRQTMSARKGHGLYAISGIDELLGLSANPAGRSAYGFARWIKGTADAQTTEMEPYYEFSFSLTEAPMKDMLLSLDGRVWNARLDTEVAEGFRVVQADEIVTKDAVATAYVTVEFPGSIDPKTLQESPGPQHNGIVTDRYLLYTKLDQAQPNNYAGDKTLLVGSAVAVPKAPVTIAGERWQVVAHQPMPGGKAFHIQKV